jgi:peptide/nickel transport system substrate-binding protein
MTHLNHSLTRRTLLAGSSAFVAAGAFGLELIAAQDSEANVVEGNFEGDPVQGGSLSIAYGEPPTLDNRVSGATDWWRAGYAVFDPLIYQEAGTLELHPGLAESWEVSEDGKEYTFTLRQGVTFHDGEPFNAEAVKYTFDSIQDPDLKSLTAIGYLGPYLETQVVDEFTAKVVFSEPYAPFLNNLSHSVLAPVSPKAGADYETFAFHPVGTGPFRFKEFIPQISMTFERNPDYNWGPAFWRNQGPAHIDEVTFRFVPPSELATRLGLLDSGEVQLTNGVAPQELSNLQSEGFYQVLLPDVPGSPQIFPLNCAKSPTDDLRVRQAMHHAIDMEAIIETLWYGGRKTAQGPLSSPTMGYDPLVESYYPYDVEKAKSLLDEAGWVEGEDGIREKDGEKLSVLTIITGGVEGKNAELVQAYLRDVGFENQVDIQEYAQTAPRMLAGEHHIARVFFSHTDPVVLTTLYHSKNIEGTGFNRTMLPDPELDSMLDAAQSELDHEARMQMYSDIQKYIMDNAKMIPRWEERVFWVGQSDLHGLHFQPLGGPWLNDVWFAG